MKIGNINPIYSANSSNKMEIYFSASNEVINFTGLSYSESKYKLLEKALDFSTASLIVTDSDRICFDDLLPKLKSLKDKTLLVFYNDVASGCPNKIRIQKAVKKLRSQKIKVKYCKDLASANLWLEKNGYDTLTLERADYAKDVKLIQWRDKHLSIVA
jgi:hypothetical protein